MYCFHWHLNKAHLILLCNVCTSVRLSHIVKQKHTCFKKGQISMFNLVLIGEHYLRYRNIFICWILYIRSVLLSYNQPGIITCLFFFKYFKRWPLGYTLHRISIICRRIVLVATKNYLHLKMLPLRNPTDRIVNICLMTSTKGLHFTDIYTIYKIIF